MVNNNAGNGDTGLAALLKAGRVRKIICSFPRQADSHVFDELYRSRPHRAGTGAAGQPGRAHRAAGAGIGAFFTPTGYGTELAKNPDGSPKETRVIDGACHVLEYPIYGDLALIRPSAATAGAT
jgi:3-oxoadipate CoA-transferase alpha subunit